MPAGAAISPWAEAGGLRQVDFGVVQGNDLAERRQGALELPTKLPVLPMSRIRMIMVPLYLINKMGVVFFFTGYRPQKTPHPFFKRS